ncbi:MAG: amidohydrolase [Candidatus Latescibacteria bacterium]|nr:amidohydrolase [Candidatus Latescibacterota bacterium]
MLRHTVLVAFIVFASALSATAQDAKDQVAASIESRRSTYADIARQIWSFAELGYQEVKSSSLLQSQLKAAGFEVQAGVAEMPTAFVATYGKGKPIIAILAEFDALPGLSQDAIPERRSIVEHGPGHACGHHLFGTASTAAAIAVKDWLVSSGTTGTIRLYGTPAEEGGSGKVYMVRAGLFDDVDVVLHWHPFDRNDASPATTLANKSAKFRFYGISSHAAMYPDRGRSALDGVEAMDYMVNMMREHIPSDARIHYIITHGGEAPNVVPDFAEAYYYVRHPNVETLEDLWARVVKASEGAALGTGTRVEHEIISGVYSLLPNETLSRLMDGNLRRVGGVKHTPEEKAFAEAVRKTFGNTDLLLGSEEEIQPYKLKALEGSTDAGDVSWVVPTAGVRTATWVPGTATHSWQAVAAGGMSIGMKGMIVAAKVIAMTAVDLFTDPSHVKAARAEIEQRRGKDFRYQPLLGERKPPLDYRNKEK